MPKWAHIENIVIYAVCGVCFLITESLWSFVPIIFINYPKRKDVQNGKAEDQHPMGPSSENIT